MHRIPIYQVDAFTGAVFGGNPAAVCPLPDWLPDATLRAIAAENNLSETAFLIPGRDPVPLRWFTPRLEVKLCGHATLASAFVLFEFIEPGRQAVTFETMSGRLIVTREPGEGDRLSMDFPAIGSARLEPDDVPASLIEGLGAEPDEVRFTDDDWNYVAVFADADTVTGLRPDFRLIEEMHPHGVAATGPGGAGDEADFVSRYFVPSYGIPEDPVTGSIHCALAPYWAGRLGTTRLSARQVSERGGRLELVVAGERVHIAGTAVTYMTGEIVVP